jgi:rod shape-determining protein MreD
MLIDPRAFIFLGANILLLYLAQLVNNSLAGAGVYLFLLGAIPVMPALYLRYRSALLCILISGLWVDAAFPVPFGLFTIAFLFAGTLTSLLRTRLRPEHSYHPFILTHWINAAAILFLSLVKGFGNYTVSELWIQTFITIALSSLALLLITPWFLQFQRMLIQLFHLDPEPEDLPLR